MSSGSEQFETKTLPIIPLKEIVVFPNSITPLFIVRQKSLLALEACLEREKEVFLLTQRGVDCEHPGPDDLYEVGCTAEVLQVLRLPDGTAKILVEGHDTARVLHFITKDEFLQGVIDLVEYQEGSNKRINALRRTVENQFDQYARLSEKLPEDLANSIKSIEEPLQLANAVANYCHLKIPDKQRVLEARKVTEKLLMLSQLMGEENELLDLENKILNQVKSKIGKSQKEYFLSEQLKIIEKELGMTSEDDMELEEYETRIRKSKMSDEARERAIRELGRLSRMPQLSPEATVSRTYVEWLLDLPWGKLTKDQEDLERAAKILDEDHYGLQKIKERIIEHLAVLKLVQELKGPIICLVGPPGVGKTSLARSIARTLKRRFVRVSLGGLRDEAEIRGHRRTYIGSLPGKIVQWMKKAGSMNPVFLLDEVDKMSDDFRGDPASALLEVLDPEQNKAFNDHYLEIDFDLSRVMFITTANTTAGISAPLLDRMELIRLPGYTEDEKRKIARQFLVPKQLKAHGLNRRRVRMSDSAIDRIILRYTREAGVRNLEREIASICRKTARSIVSAGKEQTLTINPERVRELLGPERHQDPQVHETAEVGVATGLAWTEAGGELLPTETTTMPGKGILQLTGKLGEVMQESGKASLSYLRSQAERYGLPRDFHKKLDMHVHIPEGAIPKDGPSAGVTLVTSMLSALTGRPVRKDMAMTGEITLRGKVLKIGGLKEKIIAAHRNHIRTVIIPCENEPELEEIAPEIREPLQIIPVRTIDEVLAIALSPSGKSRAKKPSPPGKSKRKAPRRTRITPAIRAPL